MNRIGSMLLEFGISLPKGHHQMKNVIQRILDHDELLPPLLLLEVKQYFDHYELLNSRIKEQDDKLQRNIREEGTAKLLQTILGIGPITACCCLSAVPNPRDFKNGRNFAAWIGLVPYQYSTGDKSRLLGISKRGNKELKRRKPFN
ncbi:putative IS1328 transposase [Photobacterium gaetbulicola Gung47]|uniref:Putative IS1328 transposase n=1 Tax=Photobacterium gaetbulicola Gung47 TaxID=658445 RepID=A0A0C5WJ56_9GAMM|nr:putative IS1328 transposase [Photobacterium gaetbulicola Gung47]